MGEMIMAFIRGLSWRDLLSLGTLRTKEARTRRRSFVPRLDILEDRCVPALTLMDHGQLVYDRDAVDLKADGNPGAKGVYWLANADLAATQTFGVDGINPDGSMTWETALNWVAAMNAFNNNQGYLGYHNWTLPLTPNYDSSNKATQTGPDPYDDSFGFDFYSSLFGHLFYNDFGGRAGESVASLPAANHYFQNLQPAYYWGGDLPTNTRSTPVDFSFNNGYLATDVAIDFEFALPECSVDASDQPVKPRSNNVLNLQSLPIDASLSPNPDGQTVHDSGGQNMNINWLANADLAESNTFGVQGINADGSMNYPTATAWIAAMNAADYLGHNNWRLPTSDAEDTSGYERTDAEMGELFYTELGGQAGSTIQLTHDADYGLFSNLQAYLYWSSTNVLDTSGDTKDKSHETLSFGNGYRSGNTDPNEVYVLPAFDGGVLMVINSADSGPGSLRAAIAAAQPGDAIEFSPGLIGATITLQSPIDIDKLLFIVGPGADELTINGNNGTRLFNVGSYAPGSVPGETTSISGLTLESGKADEGGAILDDGAPLTLKSDVFDQNQAVGGPEGNGSGGAAAVLAEATTNMDCSTVTWVGPAPAATMSASPPPAAVPPAAPLPPLFPPAPPGPPLAVLAWKSSLLNRTVPAAEEAKSTSTAPPTAFPPDPP
jgi:hypothetical protein